MLRARSVGLHRLAAQMLQQAQPLQAALTQFPVFIDDRQPSAAAAPPQQQPHWSLLQRHFSSPAAFKAAVSNARPQSLAHHQDTGELPDDDSIGGWKHFLLKLGGFYSRESSLARGSKGLYQTIVQQSEDPELKRGCDHLLIGCIANHDWCQQSPCGALELENRFADTYALLVLHMWLLLVRLRSEGADGRDLAQTLYEGFQDDVELRVHAAGVKVRVGKWLKDLEKMFYGNCEAYEKALKGEQDMTEALLRNVYGNDPSKRHAAVALSQYIRRELACLQMTPSDAVMRGKIAFSTFHRLVQPAQQPPGAHAEALA